MSAASAAVSVPIDTLNPVRAPSAATARTPAEIRKTAEDFEAAFLSSMLQPIFNQLPTDGMFHMRWIVRTAGTRSSVTTAMIMSIFFMGWAR